MLEIYTRIEGVEMFSDHDLEEQKRCERMTNYKEQVRRYYEKHPEQKKIYHKRVIRDETV